MNAVRFSHGAYLSVLIVLAILIALIFSSAITAEEGMDGILLTSFVLNGFVGLLFLIEEVLSVSVSLKMMHWIFYLTFLVIAPLTQELYSYSPWGYTIGTQEVVFCNALIFVWGISFRVFAGSSNPQEDGNAYKRLIGSLPIITSRYLFLLFILSTFSCVLVIQNTGFGALFSFADYSNGLDKTSSLLFETIVRPIPVFSLAAAIIYCRQQEKATPWLIPLTLLVVLADFPTGMPRFAMACLYGGLAILTFESLMNKKGLFAILFLIVFLVVFPALNTFKWNGFELDTLSDALASIISDLPKGFCAVDYDAFSMLARTVSYVKVFGTTHCNSILTVLLFFIPRSIWPGKAEASGEIIAIAQGQLFTNLACPLPAEGYINLGFIGLLLFAGAYGLLCKLIDGLAFGDGQILGFVYCFIVPISFYLLRGALLSGWAYSFGYAVVSSCLIYGAHIFGRSGSAHPNVNAVKLA